MLDLNNVNFYELMSEHHRSHVTLEGSLPKDPEGALVEAFVEGCVI